VSVGVYAPGGRKTMPRIHMTCDTRLKVSEIKAGELYCPTCDKVVEKKDTYKVGKRFFQSEKSQLEKEKKEKKRRKLKWIKRESRRKKC